jgi:hypothetical protein
MATARHPTKKEEEEIAHEEETRCVHCRFGLDDDQQRGQHPPCILTCGAKPKRTNSTQSSQQVLVPVFHSPQGSSSTDSFTMMPW